jgi:hypothetical protein
MKMGQKPVETISRIRRWELKMNDGGGEFNNDIL